MPMGCDIHPTVERRTPAGAIAWSTTTCGWCSSSTARRPLVERVEDHAGQDLREEVGRLRRHALPGRGDGADALDRGAAHEERGVGVAELHARASLLGVARVVEPVQVRDV